ncbi:AvrE-family type 3 secretion system effector [Pokkaliibacter sp. CJK22405]|uniref:AvrE-family type 3 secretion system effector n=1 Tax=Pokkaliibacter sp. CJK22405 TaxID=3384615 RepID=UPI0039850AED
MAIRDLLHRSSRTQELDSSRFQDQHRSSLLQQRTQQATRTDSVRAVAASASDSPQVTQGRADGQQKNRMFSMHGLRDRIKNRSSKNAASSSNTSSAPAPRMASAEELRQNGRPPSPTFQNPRTPPPVPTSRQPAAQTQVNNSAQRNNFAGLSQNSSSALQSRTTANPQLQARTNGSSQLPGNRVIPERSSSLGFEKQSSLPPAPPPKIREDGTQVEMSMRSNSERLMSQAGRSQGGHASFTSGGTDDFIRQNYTMVDPEVLEAELDALNAEPAPIRDKGKGPEIPLKSPLRNQQRNGNPPEVQKKIPGEGEINQSSWFDDANSSTTSLPLMRDESFNKGPSGKGPEVPPKPKQLQDQMRREHLSLDTSDSILDAVMKAADNASASSDSPVDPFLQPRTSERRLPEDRFKFEQPAKQPKLDDVMDLAYFEPGQKGAVENHTGSRFDNAATSLSKKPAIDPSQFLRGDIDLDAYLDEPDTEDYPFRPGFEGEQPKNPHPDVRVGRESFASNFANQRVEAPKKPQVETPEPAPAAPEAKSSNPFKRLDNWINTNSKGEPTNKLRKKAPKTDEEVAQNGKGVQFDIRVRDDGRLQMGKNNSPQMMELLNRTIAANGRRFEKSQMLAGSQHSPDSKALIRDTEGLTHYIRSSFTGLTAMHSSLPTKPGEGALDLPDYQHEAIMTDVHTDRNGGTYRLHDGRLMQFSHVINPEYPTEAGKAVENGEWKTLPNPFHEESRFISMQTSGGRVTSHAAVVDLGEGGEPVMKDGKHEISQALIDMSSGDNNVLFSTKDRIDSYHRDQRGRTAVLTEGENGHKISLKSEHNRGEPLTFSFRLNPHEVGESKLESAPAGKPSHIALSDNTIYVSDRHGELYSITTAEAEEAAANNRAIPMRHHPSSLGALGNEHKVTGFFTDNSGKLNMLVKDAQNNQHACPETARGNFKPGWNLGDALITHNHTGLKANENAGGAFVHSDRFGTMRLDAGKLQYRDALSGNWRVMDGHNDVRDVNRGLDGHNYAVIDGQVRKLSFPESSDKQNMGANVYSLGVQRNEPSVSGQLRGGTANDNFVSAAVVNSHHYVALDADGKATVFAHSRATNAPLRQPVSLPTQGVPEGSKLTQIYLDQKKNLVGITDKGELLSMPESSWEDPLAAHRDVSWTPMNVPAHERDDNTPVHISMSGSGELMLSSGESRFRLNGNDWTPGEIDQNHDATALGKSAFDTTFERLEHAEVTKNIKGRDVHFTAGVLGWNNAEKPQKVQSGFRERLRAHYVRFDMQTPRPFKIGMDAAQHRYRGRDGLQDLYSETSRLHSELDGLQRTTGRTPVANLAQRFANLELEGNLGKEGKRLLDEIRLFKDELDRSAFHSLSVAALKAKVVDVHGHIKENPKARHQHGVTHASGHNLVTELKNLWDFNGMSSGATGSMLQTLADKGVDLGHAKSDIPMGRRRDLNDDAALSKARLALNTSALDKLNGILSRLEDLGRGNVAPNERQLKGLWESFSNIRDNEYRANDVRRLTDMGHTDFKDVEANYDTIKGFLKAYSKDDHGVTMTTRSALDVKTREEMREKMKSVVRSLREGETLAIGRAYEGGVSTVYNPANNIPVFTAALAGATAGVSRSMAITRDDGEMIVSLGRQKAQRIQIGSFIGQNVLPLMAGLDMSDPAFSEIFKFSDWSNGTRDAGFDLRAGAITTASFSHAARNGIDFILSEHEIDKFIDGLISGGLEPQELLEMGMDHMNHHGHTLAFSLDFQGRFGLRAGLDLTNENADPYSMARVELGLNSNLNLYQASRTKDQEHTETGGRDSKTTSSGFLNRGGVNLGLQVQGFSQKDINDRPDQIQEYSSFTGIHGRIAFEDSSSKKVEVQIKQPGEPNYNEVESLIKELSGTFTDADSKTRLDRINNLTAADFNEPMTTQGLEMMKLKMLSTEFADKKHLNHDQALAVGNLRNLQSRAIAHANHTSVMGYEVKYSTDFNNMERLDHDRIIDVLLSHIDDKRAATASKQLREFAKSDPQLRHLLDEFKKTKNARARISMELREDVKQKANRMLAEGKISAADVALLMTKPENVRIREFKVLSSTGLAETFTPIQIIAGGGSVSSVGMEKLAGRVMFHYGADDSSLPTDYSIMGDSAQVSKETREAASTLATEHNQQVV